MIIISLVTSILWISIAKAENFWKPLLVDLAQAQEENLGRSEDDKTLLRPTHDSGLQNCVVFSDWIDGHSHSRAKAKEFLAKFGKGEEPYSKAVVTVEFLGYADDSLNGEQFILYLKVGKDGLWQNRSILR